MADLTALEAINQKIETMVEAYETYTNGMGPQLLTQMVHLQNTYKFDNNKKAFDHLQKVIGIERERLQQLEENDETVSSTTTKQTTPPHNVHILVFTITIIVLHEQYRTVFIVTLGIKHERNWYKYKELLELIAFV